MPGKEPRIASVPSVALSVDQVAEFFAALSTSCNVRHSARAANVCTARIYKERRDNPEFRAQWAAALAEGHVFLEAAVMADALATPRAAKTLNGQKERDRKQKLRLWLLDAHRSAVVAHRAGDEADLRASAKERLLAKLDAMAESLADGASCD